jgi:mRNA interferase MazF
MTSYSFGEVLLVPFPFTNQATTEYLISDWAEAGLLKPSVMKPIVTSLEKTLVLKSLGHLQAVDKHGLESILQQIIGA